MTIRLLLKVGEASKGAEDGDHHVEFRKPTTLVEVVNYRVNPSYNLPSEFGPMETTVGKLVSLCVYMKDTV